MNTRCVLAVVGIVVILVVQTARPSTIPKLTPDIRPSAKDPVELTGISCDICDAVIQFLRDAAITTKTEDDAIKLVIDVCREFHIEDSIVCTQAIGEYKAEVAFVVLQLLTSPKQLCPLLVNNCGRPAYDPMKPWDLQLPNPNKPPVEDMVQPPAGSPTMKILQLADLHIDPAYTVGSESDCGEPLCCRHPVTGNEKKPTGKWGTTTGLCDIPNWTVEAILDYIAKNEEFDYIIFTGDLPPHNIWHQNITGQTYLYNHLTSLFQKYFKNRMVYSAVGNHESVPMDSYPPHWSFLPQKYSEDWLYKTLNDSWRHYLGPETSATIRKIASYVVKVKPGLRLISLNTVYCQDYNFWLLLNQTDPDGALGWFMKQLQDAEDAGDKVHVIAHAPPDDCALFYSYSHVYYKIVNRYESTIRAQFMGHEHTDAFRLFFDNNDSNGRVTNMLFTSPSITTFQTQFPAYRIYTVDSRQNGTWGVLDHVTKFVNLTKANLSPDKAPQIETEYVATDAYNVENLFPETMNGLRKQMESDTGTVYVDRYAKYYHSSSGATCDHACRKKILCRIRKAMAKDGLSCDSI